MSSPQSLLAYVEASALIVDVTVPSALSVDPGESTGSVVRLGTEHFQFANGTNVLNAGKPTGPFDVIISGSAPAPEEDLLPGREYVLFLTPLEQQSTDTPTYTTAMGLHGRYAIEGGRVSAVCANAQTPESPIVATGSGVAVSEFEQTVLTASRMAGAASGK